MSKMVLSLPRGLFKNSVVGAGISLLSYTVLQFLTAFLMYREVLGEGALYGAVCFCAAAASFLGCAYSARHSGNGMALSATTVVCVFLALTVCIALCMSDIETIGVGLTGVGIAMAVGGLVAAIVCGAIGQKPKREKKRGKRRTRG